MSNFQIHLNSPVQQIVSRNVGGGPPLPTRIVGQNPSPADVRSAKPRVPGQPNDASHASIESEALRREMMTLMQKITSQLAEANQKHQQLVTDLHQFAIRVGVIAARAVTLADSKNNDQRIERLIEIGLARLHGTAKITARVNPQACDRLQHEMNPAVDAGRFELVADSTIAPGDIQLDHPLFSLTACGNEQFEQIQRALLESLERADSQF